MRRALLLFAALAAFAAAGAQPDVRSTVSTGRPSFTPSGTVTRCDWTAIRPFRPPQGRVPA